MRVLRAAWRAWRANREDALEQALEAGRHLGDARRSPDRPLLPVPPGEAHWDLVRGDAVKHGDRIPRADGPRPFSELIETGLLWYLNRVAFHPRGFAIGLCVDDGEIVGWELHGDGTEPWSFNEEVDDAKFAAAEATFDAAKATQQLEEDMRTVFAPKQLPDYAAYKKLTDPLREVY